MTDKPGLVSTGIIHKVLGKCGQYNAGCSRTAKYGYNTVLDTAKTSGKANAGCIMVLCAAVTCG